MLSNKEHNEKVYEESIVTFSRDMILEKKYGEKYTDYRLNWNKDIKCISDIPAFPLHYDIQLVDACNLHCAICHSRIRSGKKIDTALLKKVLREGAEKGLCSFSVGADSEGLIDKDLLMDIISYAHDIGIMDILIGTNGIFLDCDFSKRLLGMLSTTGYGPTALLISLDAASPDTYKKIRHSDCYEKVEKNILNFINLRKEYGLALPEVRLSFCKTYINSFETNTFINKWNGIVDHIDIQNYISLVGEFQELQKGKKLDFKSCVDPFRRVTIYSNGDVQCCCAFGHKDIIIGNIHESSISDIWNGERMKAIQTAFLMDLNKIPPYCKRCLNSRYQF